ncbi:MAG: plasmid mobilization protein [Lysobacter sp.]
MARPPLPDSERRSEVLQLRLTKDERKDLDAGANAAGEQTSEFIRTAALVRAQRELGKVKRPSKP